MSSIQDIWPTSYHLCETSGTSLDLDHRLETRLMVDITVCSGCGDQGRYRMLMNVPVAGASPPVGVMPPAVTNKRQHVRDFV